MRGDIKVQHFVFHLKLLLDYCMTKDYGVKMFYKKKKSNLSLYYFYTHGYRNIRYIKFDTGCFE